MKTDGSYLTTHDYQLIGIGNIGCKLVYEIYKHENLKDIYAVNYDDRKFADMSGIKTLKIGNVNWDVPSAEQSGLESKYTHSDFRILANSSVMQLNETFYNKKKKLILITYLGEKFASAVTPMIIKRASNFGKQIHVFILMPFLIGRYKGDQQKALKCVTKIVANTGWLHFCNFNNVTHNLGTLSLNDYYHTMIKVILKWIENELPITRF